MATRKAEPKAKESKVKEIEPGLFQIDADQSPFVMTMWSGRKSYLWVGATDGTSRVVTLDTKYLKKLLRAAGQI